MFGMGTGVAPAVWPPGKSLSSGLLPARRVRSTSSGLFKISGNWNEIKLKWAPWAALRG